MNFLLVFPLAAAPHAQSGDIVLNPELFSVRIATSMAQGRSPTQRLIYQKIWIEKR